VLGILGRPAVAGVLGILRTPAGELKTLAAPGLPDALSMLVNCIETAPFAISCGEPTEATGDANVIVLDLGRKAESGAETVPGDCWTLVGVGVCRTLAGVNDDGVSNVPVTSPSSSRPVIGPR